MPDNDSRDDDYYELLAHGRTPRSFPAGEVIFRKGEPGKGLFLVREGSVDEWSDAMDDLVDPRPRY